MTFTLPAPRTYGPLTRTDFVRYQGASGDMNPLHHDEEFCRARDLPMPMGPGMLGAGVLAGWLVGVVPPASVRRYRVRFEGPVWPGDSLTCVATAIREYDEDGRGMLDLELVCRRQTGDTAIRGWATCVREDPA
ncbi:dihydroxy-acid dehydratase [Pseudonocardia ailaonensis]|uniref:Dihydroxy-acid dehydratase n=1 Tax=Pseudonocardia ailaonensis TaxID=367279 RepID=A0ABN2NIV3_9PSEU